jgi:nuclease-like protein
MQRPIPDPDPHWPSCDDEPPGVSIRPLSHADLAALLARFDHHDHDQDLDDDPAWTAGPAPMVAVRVRATVGRPGASAQAAYHRRRAAEWAAWTRSLPWRAAAVLAAGTGVGLLATQAIPRLAGPTGLLAAALLAWMLRFRVSADTQAWRRGAAGERRTARLLSRLEDRGWVVLHDLAIPGSRANIDHLVIGSGGVVVVDSKQYRGRLHLDPHGFLWHGRHLLVSTLRKVLWEADQADEVLGVADITVGAIVAVHGGSLPWSRLEVDGVTVTAAQRVPDLLRALPPVLGPERVAWLADRARLRFRPAA